MQNEHKQGKLTVEIGGKSRTLFFDYVFLSLLFEQFPGKTIDDIFATSVHRAVPLITCFALLAGEEENDLPEGFNERKAAVWLRDIDTTVQAQIMDGYKHSMGFMTAVFAPLMLVDEPKSKK